MFEGVSGRTGKFPKLCDFEGKKSLLAPQTPSLRNPLILQAFLLS